MKGAALAVFGKVMLKDLRARIDAIDERIIRALIQRQKIAEKIAEYKKKKGLPAKTRYAKNSF